jgi:hypothetical protein
MRLAFKMTVSGTALCGVDCHEADFDLVSLPASFNVWLASPEARFLKGKFLWANWDVDELKCKAKEIEAGTQLSIGLVGWPFRSEKWSSMWKS